MNSKNPCIVCLIRPACSKFCDELLTYYSRLVKSYVKYGTKSLLFKHALKQDKSEAQRIQRAIGAGYRIWLTNTSGDDYQISYTGRVKYYGNLIALPRTRHRIVHNWGLQKGDK